MYTRSFCARANFSSLKRQSLISETFHGRKRLYYIEKDKIKHEWESERDQHRLFSKGKSLFMSMFMPIGYPHSVHSVYAKVHLWQFVETMMGSALSVFCNQAMLESIGVGHLEAAGSAVAIQWVLKDGFGEIGKLFFIQRFAGSFDSHPKLWKLFGEFSSLVGCALQLCTVLAPSSWFLPLASLGYAARSIHFSIWGATHMTFTRNFAKQGNVGDLVAKDDSQMSVAHLLGMLAGVGLLSFSHSASFLFTCFAILGPGQIISTWTLMHAAKFETLNDATLRLLVNEYLETNSVSTAQQLEQHPKLYFGEHLKDSKLPKIIFGASLKQVVDSESLMECIKIYQDESYMIVPREGRYYFYLKEESDTRTVIQAYLNMNYLFKHPHDPTKALQWSKDHVDILIHLLNEANWKTDIVFWGDNGHRIK